MDKRLHGLVHTRYGLVDGMLYDAVLARQSVQRLQQIVGQFLLIEMGIVFSIQFFQVLDFLDEAVAHVGGKVEIECRDGLSAVHLVLGCFQRDASQDTGSLDAFGRARFAVSGREAVFQNMGVSKKDFIRLSKSMVDLNFMDSATALDCPALILCGAKDKTNMESAKRFHEAMKNSKLVIVEASGHEVNKDNPNELVRVLQDFWADR